jgi:hypothetical protein
MEPSARARAPRAALWEWALLAVYVVVGGPLILLLLLFVPFFFAIRAPAYAVLFLGVAIAGTRAPYAWWLEPRYGPKVVWGCTGATLGALCLIGILAFA